MRFPSFSDSVDLPAPEFPTTAILFALVKSTYFAFILVGFFQIGRHDLREKRA